MARWTALSEVVARLQAAREPALETGNLRQDAALLVYRVYQAGGLADSVLVNVGALALSMPRLTVHRLSSGAARLVHETDLHSLPAEPPTLLRRAWLLEARNPSRESLFGATVCLAGYPLEDSIYLVGFDWPDWAYAARWRPRWEGRDLEEGLPQEVRSPLLEDVDRHKEWARDAARFAVVFALLLEAEGSELVAEDEPSARARRPRRREPRDDGRAGTWLVRRVYLDEPRREGISRRPRGETALLDGRRPIRALVRGHLKRQFYGPGRSLRKWVYVRSYEARRWIAPRPLRVEVRTRRDAD